MEIKEHYLCKYLETAVAVAGSGDGEGAVTGRTGQPAPGEGEGSIYGSGGRIVPLLFTILNFQTLCNYQM